MTTAIVYVQLGKNPAKTLSLFALQAKRTLTDSEIYLLADYPEMWPDFPGHVVDVSQRIDSAGFLRFRKQNKELERIAGGYWLNTLKRLFVLEAMQDFSSDWEDLLHFESDVFSFLSKEIVECLRANANSVGIPRFSENRGIASVLYVRNPLALKRLVADLTETLETGLVIRDDMELLGIMLARDLVSQLPSLPAEAWTWQGKKYVFDGAAYGQYLFGQDPFHTQGSVISGFQNPHFNFDLSSVNWELNNDASGITQLDFKSEEETWSLANLHVHSKILLPSPSLNEAIWKKYLLEANNQIPRIPVLASETSPHSKRIDIRTRLQIAIKKGLFKVILKKILQIFR